VPEFGAARRVSLAGAWLARQECRGNFLGHKHWVFLTRRKGTQAEAYATQGVLGLRFQKGWKFVGLFG
jgi:hypothetical protein